MIDLGQTNALNKLSCFTLISLVYVLHAEDST